MTGKPNKKYEQVTQSDLPIHERIWGRQNEVWWISKPIGTGPKARGEEAKVREVCPIVGRLSRVRRGALPNAEVARSKQLQPVQMLEARIGQRCRQNTQEIKGSDKLKMRQDGGDAVEGEGSSCS